MTWHTKKTTLFAAVAIACSTSIPAATWACTLCIGFPDKTDADYLIESQCVVLARQAEGNPFAYAPQRVLKGAYDGSDINLLVDTMTRRVLAGDPERQVILVQAKRGGGWRSLGLTSDEYLAVIRRIVIFGEGWSGDGGAQQRWQFFLPLFGHIDNRIRELAYLEMGRSPYAVIRQLGQTASREVYAPLLSDPKYLEWRSLAILLLSQSENPVDEQRIRDSLHSASRFGMTTNLAAWAAAAIELDGASTIDFIEEEYFLRPDRSVEEIQAVTKALSMHGSEGDSQLQDRIVASYGLLLRAHPEIAPKIAEDLLSWKRTELVDDLAVVSESRKLEYSEGQSIRRYLRAAAAPQELALADD